MNKDEHTSTAKHESSLKTDSQELLPNTDTLKVKSDNKIKESKSGRESQEALSVKENPEPNPTAANHEGKNSSNSQNEQEAVHVLQKESSYFQILVSVIQIAASIATVVMAVLAWQTLVEMKTERNNAYRPEIVVVPNTFSGGLEKPDDDKDYLTFVFNDYNPYSYYTTDHFEDSDYFYLEKPYLTLKNIGLGTAKDVHVTFQKSWLDSAVAILNENDSDDFTYAVLGNSIFYTKPDSPNYIQVPSTIDSLETSITYIASGEDSVNIYLPNNWYTLFKFLYFQQFRLFGPNAMRINGSNYIQIPDLLITIRYTDIQGNLIEQKEAIPWTGSYSYVKSSHYKGAKLNAMFIRTAFYKDYLR